MWNGSVFDASDVSPEQGAGKHPPGKFIASISGLEIVPTKDATGNMLVVDFTTPSGEIKWRLNLWNESAEAKRIATSQLAALCCATGVMKIDMATTPPANGLMNARCMIEVRDQKGNEKYSEVFKILDINGNEPGKAPAPKADSPFGGGGPQAQAQPAPFNPNAKPAEAAPFNPNAGPQSGAQQKAPWNN